jgi:hypothetical protein
VAADGRESPRELSASPRELLASRSESSQHRPANAAMLTMKRICLWQVSALNTQLASVPTELEHRLRAAERVTPTPQILEVRSPKHAPFLAPGLVFIAAGFPSCESPSLSNEPPGMVSQALPPCACSFAAAAQVKSLLTLEDPIDTLFNPPCEF